MAVDSSHPLVVYLAGHIHSNWRDELCASAEARALPVRFAGPVEDHGLSDNVGVKLFKISKGYGGAHHEKLRDELSGAINSVRTEVLIANSDLVLAYFDVEHGNLRQWSPSSDIATACASGKPLIVVADGSLGHALKEVRQHARVWVYTLEQALDLISYITTDEI